MKRHCLPVTMLLCGVLFMACEKEDVADTTTYGIQYQLTTSNPSSYLSTIPVGIINGAASTATTVSWVSGSAVAKRIRFEATGDDEIDVRTAVETPILMIGPVSNLGIVSIPAGDYEDVRFTIELSRTDPFELTGEYNGTPLVLRITDPVSFELSQEALSVSERTNYNALTTLNLSKLLQGISGELMSEAVVSNGKVLISSTSNQRLYNIILDNMKSLGEMEFGKQ